MLAAAVAQPPAPTSPPLPHDRLPVYTVICALYREAASAGELLAALARLDYPREKLDIVIALEADDHDTRAAIEKRIGCLPVTLVTVPASGPRTKPKALNAALPFARGSFTVIYDAEDRPEPDQLRRALQAFGAGGDRLACVQAKLCIDNTGDGWLARMFTAEYAGQFDVFLPGLAAMRLPLPLGGSSNHFRTATLRAIGGWDAYNVTEDADLGIRLSRFGYRTAVINSTTYEEAPARLGAWLRQRTRWFKGWMQTWAVHMRTPWRLARELGLGGFLAFQLIVGGNALAALVHPLFLATLLVAALARRFLARRRRRRAGGDLRRHRARRLSGIGLARLHGAQAARIAEQRLGAVADAAALAVAVARRLARALAAHAQALCLGENRARPGEKLAAGERHDTCAGRTRAPPHAPESERTVAGLGGPLDAVDSKSDGLNVRTST